MPYYSTIRCAYYYFRILKDNRSLKTVQNNRSKRNDNTEVVIYTVILQESGYDKRTRYGTGRANSLTAGAPVTIAICSDFNLLLIQI